MATVSIQHYLVNQTTRRLTPTVNTIPGMRAIEKRLLNMDSKTRGR